MYFVIKKNLISILIKVWLYNNQTKLIKRAYQTITIKRNILLQFLFKPKLRIEPYTQKPSLKIHLKRPFYWKWWQKHCDSLSNSKTLKYSKASRRMDRRFGIFVIDKIFYILDKSCVFWMRIWKGLNWNSCTCTQYCGGTAQHFMIAGRTRMFLSVDLVVLGCFCFTWSTAVNMMTSSDSCNVPVVWMSVGDTLDCCCLLMWHKTTCSTLPNSKWKSLTGACTVCALTAMCTGKIHTKLLRIINRHVTPHLLMFSPKILSVMLFFMFLF